MSLTTAARGLVLFLLTVPVIQGQKGYDVKYTSTEICGLRGSTVDISCTYTYPRRVDDHDTTVQESFWFIRESNGIYADLKSDPDYSDRVEYLCDNNRCTLTIKDLRESDAALYKFRFITNQPRGSFTGSPGVTLSVTDLQVQVDTLHEHQFYNNAKLTCQSSCLPDHSSFIWYEGQSKATEGATYSARFSSSDSISCAVKGHESSHSPSVLIWRRKGYDVKYTSTEICGFRGSTVDISCTYTYPHRVHNQDTKIQESFWFIKESDADLKSDPDYSGRVEYLCDNNRCTLTIKDLRESDAALYKFRFITNQPGGRFTGLPGVTLSVTDPQLQINVRSLAHYSPWKELTCHSSCQLPDYLSYVWYNNGQEVGGKTKYLLLRVFSPTDSYHCEHGSIRSPPVYAPKLPSVSVSSSGQIVEGSSVTLTCSSDANPEATCIWYKNQTLIKGAERIYRLSPISSEDRGLYECSCQNLYGTTTTSKYLHVQYAPKSPSVSVSPSGQIVEGRSVTLTCSSDANPAATYTWYKENTHAHAQLLREGLREFVFTSIQSSDSGLYRCVARNELGESPGKITVAVEYAPKLPSVSVSPSGIVEGSSVTLTCSADANPEATCIWYKNQTLIKGAERIYHLSPISSEDRGLYECSCQNVYGTTTTSKYLHVQYAPKLPSVSVSPSGQIVEGRSVTLTCSADANPEATCIWYKNQTLIKGAERIYRLSPISSEDRGRYECSCQNLYGTRITSKYVDVLYAPKSPSVSVSPSGLIMEGSSVTLTCSSDANPAADYTWYKDNEDSVKATGHNFTITDIRPEHGGHYYCQVKNTRGSQSAMFRLNVTVSTEVLKTAITGTSAAVLFVMVLLTIIFLMRKKRTSEQPSEPGDRANHSEQLEEVIEPHYVSVHFVKKQTDGIYSNIQPGPHRNMMKQKENEEDVVEYSAVKFRSRGQETVEDPTALYSVLKKPTR
ncbi:B-cell receptor CD22-like [Solea senegalensis]|uniref:B-cell receptor CD22 n=1 Tax=Solea senegalensis TaxID=28829 RepID=A0AAV6SD44_SOLSE|nr:B-cell receptor CD22-like isoform X1 [Solea senegalensis]KAG7514858.1 B-cell receptor CD22-like [Solea senegalensis]